MSLCWVKSRPWQQDEERGLTGARGTYTVTLVNVRVLMLSLTYLVHSGKQNVVVKFNQRSIHTVAQWSCCCLQKKIPTP